MLRGCTSASAINDNIIGIAPMLPISDCTSTLLAMLRMRSRQPMRTASSSSCTMRLSTQRAPSCRKKSSGW